MKAMIAESFGDLDQLKLADVPKPQPKDNEILIAIEYAGVNPVDWKILEGHFKSKMPHEFPLILGWDAAGIIEAIGKNVHSFKNGDKVFAYCRKPIIKEGTFAEFISLDEANVAKMPKNCSFAQASSVPLAALTAWQALFDFAKIKEGQGILIHAGSGGVGGFAIQFAKYAKAKVYTTCSTDNIDYVKQLGADHVIDYTHENVAERIQKGSLDVVLDTIGGKVLRDSFYLLKKGGSLLSIVEQIPKEISENSEIQSGFVFVRPDGKQLAEIAKLIEEEKVRVLPLQEMALEGAADALYKSKQGHTKGKIVLKIMNRD